MGGVSLLPLRLRSDRRGKVLLHGWLRRQQGTVVLTEGIVPISCEEIFNRIGKNNDENRSYEVQASMMEIYNERVQDLLIPISKRPKEGHKIREHKTLGIYVEGMSKHYVDTYESIEKKMEEGGRKLALNLPRFS